MEALGEPDPKRRRAAEVEVTTTATNGRAKEAIGLERREGHRLHYRWSQLEAERGADGALLGSPALPRPEPIDRTLPVEPGLEYAEWPMSSSECPLALKQFSMCEDVYQTIDYNTFCKNGGLKLTEVELYFLSAKITRGDSRDWAVVYLGVGNGDRFRYLRDEFFPDLTVVAFDPIDDNYSGSKDDVLRQAELWNKDGTNFTFHVRCFDADCDTAAIQKEIEGKRLLLISDIRGIHFSDDGRFDKTYDQELQWQAIKRLRPERSLVKFTCPNPMVQFYDYVPGTILKQTFCYYGSRELRLAIEGVPEKKQRYNAWELYEKSVYHHEHLRGQVYALPASAAQRRLGSGNTAATPAAAAAAAAAPPAPPPACLDRCFDCAALWETVCGYAARSEADPHEVLRSILRYHVYTPPKRWLGAPRGGPAAAAAATATAEQPPRDGGAAATAEQPPPPAATAAAEPWRSKRWWDVEWYLKRGNLMEAIAALEDDNEGHGHGEPQETDWRDLARGLAAEQPDLAARLESALGAGANGGGGGASGGERATRGALVRVLGSLAEPFTLVRTDLNGLLE